MYVLTRILTPTEVFHPGMRPDSCCGRWSRFNGRQLKSFKRCETSSSFDFDHPCEVSRCANVTTAWAATKNKESWWGLQISPRATYKNGLNMKLWTWLFPPITSSCLLLERKDPLSTNFNRLYSQMRNGGNAERLIFQKSFDMDFMWRKGRFSKKQTNKNVAKRTVFGVFPLSWLLLGSTQTDVDSVRCPAHDHDSKLLAPLCFKFSTDGATWKRS